MRNKKLIPFETIEKAVIGEPEAIDAVLRHYTGRIKYLSTYRGHCICTWYWETKNSVAKEYRNIRRLSGPFKRIYKKTAYLWKKEQLF